MVESIKENIFSLEEINQALIILEEDLGILELEEEILYACKARYEENIPFRELYSKKKNPPLKWKIPFNKNTNKEFWAFQKKKKVVLAKFKASTLEEVFSEHDNLIAEVKENLITNWAKRERVEKRISQLCQIKVAKQFYEERKK